MHQEHRVFRQPSDENEKVWRYIDFTKFISLLESNSLYFARADKFADPFEGSYPRVNSIFHYNLPPQVTADPEMAKIYIKGQKEMRRSLPKYVAINCWHLNNFESAAMWKLYLKSNEGIAIQSTYRRLKNSFSKTAGEIFLGQVKYIDYERDSIEIDSNMLEPFVYKRKSFEHEQEVRALLVKWPDSNDDEVDGLDFSRETIAHGVAVDVNLDVLIEKIYVAPDAPLWFVELVQSVINSYGRNYQVVQSDLNRSPLY